MSENNNEKQKHLLTQHTKRQITSKELLELKTIVNSSDNEALDETLRNLWMNDEYSAFLPSENQKIRMIQQIEQATEKENRPIIIPVRQRFIHTWSRIAALFLLVLLSGIAIHLYRNNQRLAIYKGNEIALNVGNGQEAGFTLPDGTSVRLNAGSSLRYANNFGEPIRLVNFSGEAFFEVNKDKKRPFIVSTKYMDIEVLGTSFNVYAFDNGDLIEMTLLSGSVKASSKKNPEYQVVVKPNEKVVCNISTGKLTIQETNTQHETAWLNGEIVFKSETLSNVLAKMERKYGVHIRYEGNSDLLDDRFSGRISKDNHIGDAMKILTRHYPLEYKLKGDTLTLSNCKYK